MWKFEFRDKMITGLLILQNSVCPVMLKRQKKVLVEQEAK